jgi:hypothetical protein
VSLFQNERMSGARKKPAFDVDLFSSAKGPNRAAREIAYDNFLVVYVLACLMVFSDEVGCKRSYDYRATILQETRDEGGRSQDTATTSAGEDVGL